MLPDTRVREQLLCLKECVLFLIKYLNFPNACLYILFPSCAAEMNCILFQLVSITGYQFKLPPHSAFSWSAFLFEYKQNHFIPYLSSETKDAAHLLRYWLHYLEQRGGLINALNSECLSFWKIYTWWNPHLVCEFCIFKPLEYM